MSLEKLTAKALSQKEIDRRVKEVLKNILERCKPQKIYLFGSAARGEYTEHSDFDIAIIYSDTDALKRGKKCLFSSKPNHPYAVDYLFFTQSSFDKKLEIGGVCELIANEGQLIYSKE